MSQHLVPALVAVVAVAVVWLGFALWEASSRRRLHLLGAAWTRYARERRMEIISLAERASRGSEPGPSLVHGDVQGVEIDVTVERTATRPRTRVEATLPGVAPEFVMVIQRRDGRRFSSERGLCEARTGNKAFDAAFTLLSNEPDLARSLLDRRLAQVVLCFPRSFVELCAHGKRFVLCWQGMETDARVLDAAIEVVFTACRRRA
ncbi:Hypothetical protein A7982_10505 [Minicystis rosea]|nr:Hypothetical protein A7982_10505 [Minicystis rosea]